MGRRVFARTRRLLAGLLAVVVLLLAWIGLLTVTRGTSVQRVVGVGADGVPVGPHEPRFAEMVGVLTGAALAPGHRVELALNGDGTFPRMLHDLRGATESITVQAYYSGRGTLATALVQVLVARAAAGVKVAVLYDAFGSAALSRAERSALEEAGILAVPFRPVRISRLHVAQNRSHVRGIVIDGRIGWTGGFGFDDKWLGDGHTDAGWRETNVRFEGPAVRQLQAAFAAGWTEATGDLLSGRQRQTAPTAGGPTRAGLLFASPTLGSTAAERLLALSLAGAQRTLYITNAYFAPDDNFVEMLVRAAQRGVDVQLLVGGGSTDIRLTRLAGRSRYDRLLVAGVRIFEWNTTTLHAKTLVADGIWSTVGTMNFDNRSLALNDEVALMVHDSTFGTRMEQLFANDRGEAREVTLDEFRQRSWMGRVGEGVARLINRLL